MTEAQKMTFDFIKAYLEERGRPPSIRDIQQHMGYNSTSSVKRLVDALVERGKIGRLWGKHRSIYIMPDKVDPARVRALEACRILISAYEGPQNFNWALVHDAYVEARTAIRYDLNPGAPHGQAVSASDAPAAGGDHRSASGGGALGRTVAP